MEEPSPRLPPELIDYILDYLWDQPRALGSCSLTTRQWLPTTRFHIFSTINIRTYSKLSKFEEILRESPLAGGYVRVLDIDNNQGSHIPLIRITHMLPTLVNLRSLNLCRVISPGLGNKQFECSSPSLSVKNIHIRLSSFYDADFPKFLCTFPNITTLRLRHNIWFGEDGYAPPDPYEDTFLSPELVAGVPVNTIRLTDLDITGVFDSGVGYVGWLIRSSAELPLEALRVCWNPDEPPKLAQALLRATGSALKHLTLVFEYHEEFTPDNVDNDVLSLLENGNLQSLHIEGINLAKLEDSARRRHAYSLPSLLAQVGTMAHLHDICINFKYKPPPMDTEPLELNWRNYDDALTSLLRSLPSLQVSIHVTCAIASTWFHTFEDFGATVLPQAVKSNRLQISHEWVAFDLEAESSDDGNDMIFAQAAPVDSDSEFDSDSDSDLIMWSDTPGSDWDIETEDEVDTEDESEYESEEDEGEDEDALQPDPSSDESHFENDSDSAGGFGGTEEDVYWLPADSDSDSADRIDHYEDDGHGDLGDGGSENEEINNDDHGQNGEGDYDDRDDQYDGEDEDPDAGGGDPNGGEDYDGDEDNDDRGEEHDDEDGGFDDEGEHYDNGGDDNDDGGSDYSY